MPYLFDDFHTKSFWGFLNPGNGIALYQVAGLNFYMLIWLFGSKLWLWHLFYVTMHALNGILLYNFFTTLLHDSKVANGSTLSFVAVLLFLICPSASEVVVWKCSDHHAQATAILFLILNLVQGFIHSGRARYAFFGALLFIYASFSHEFFYLAPWFVLLLLFYYYLVVETELVNVKRAFSLFFIPLILLFAGHLLLLGLVKHTYVSHFGKLDRMPVCYYLEKPLKYGFHVLFFGRFFPFDLRNKIYAICSGKMAIVLFYGLLVCWWGYILLRFHKVGPKTKATALVSVYLTIIYIFLSPVYFADSLLVCYDRYVYPSLGFAGLLVVLLASFMPYRWLCIALLAVYAGFNLFFTCQVNVYWKQSAFVINHLLNDLPDPGSKTVLLLNLPDDLNGVPMISAEEDGRYKKMKNNLTGHPCSNAVYDVEAYKMSTMNDGAHIMVINDSVLHVTLNQWGTWWLYGMLGSSSYENKDYKVNMIDEGHWYELTIRRPASQYLILYQSGAQWKTVDMNRRSVDQD